MSWQSGDAAALAGGRLKPTRAAVLRKPPVYKPALTTAPETNVFSLAKHSFLLLLLAKSADLHTVHLHQSNYPNTQPTQG